MNTFIETTEHEPLWLSCEHYMCGCDTFAECCKKYVKCRICHDEKENHKMDRFAVIKIRCRLCKTEQQVSNKCISCNIKFGNYYCEKCKLFDYLDKLQYHCDKCKICRCGDYAKEFVHCDTCNCCHIKKDEECKIYGLDIECPVCMDNLYDSTLQTSFLRCGHPIHTSCLNELLKTEYKCPICKKSVLSPEHMQPYFMNMEATILANKMPEEYMREANIYCNDCEKHSTVQFHFIGMKCLNCGSYNTTE